MLQLFFKSTKTYTCRLPGFWLHASCSSNFWQHTAILSLHLHKKGRVNKNIEDKRQIRRDSGKHDRPAGTSKNRMSFFFSMVAVNLSNLCKIDWLLSVLKRVIPKEFPLSVSGVGFGFLQKDIKISHLKQSEPRHKNQWSSVLFYQWKETPK